ncbi:MAG: hypothetical protein Kow0037_21760 [Calditrichia bacterium]
MNFYKAIWITLLVVLWLGAELMARGFRVDQVPNGAVGSCNTCHVTPGGPRNDFGETVEFRFLSEPGSAGQVMWNALLASLDSDGDGASNGEELQDPYGLWMTGNPAPGNSSLVTAPGDAGSDPFVKLTIAFSGMTPHIGQKLFIRVIDKATGMEVGREEMGAISQSDFNVDLTVLLVNHSYRVDIFADHNGNELYDPPPTDHAWRMEVDDVQGATTVNFAHNTNFVDIDWKYLLEFRLNDMNPHIGQLFQVRVWDVQSGEEIIRKRLESIPDHNPRFDLPGLEMGKSYYIDFYADHSGDFLYQPPPTDHAWRMVLNNVTGDTTLEFTHNTSFTDIAWPYLFRLNLTDMTPHVGQMFEIRIVESATGMEVQRKTYAAIPQAEFVTKLIGIQPGQSYRADFYADFNGNGVYDPPPTDHAWRINFTDSTGMVVENFSHNTNFVDIGWPTGIEINPTGEIAGGFHLFQNYPNPFNPVTTIPFEVAAAANVKLEIYNLVGQKVATVIQQQLPPGQYEAVWNGRDDNERAVSSGIYIYRLTAGEFQQVRRMILMK